MNSNYFKNVVMVNVHKLFFNWLTKINNIPSFKSLSTYSKNLSPEWVTGLIDAEGCFHLGVIKRARSPLGWEINPAFKLALDKRDSHILVLLKSFLGVGTITQSGSIVQFQIRSVKDLVNSLIPHLDKYPLQTQKQADYLLFKSGIELLNLKANKTVEGLQKFVNIRAAMNFGLTSRLKEVFPNTVAVERPEVISSNVVNPDWLAGFIEGEGCFYIQITKISNQKYQVKLTFSISQHSRDLALFKNILKYLNCGRIDSSSTRLDEIAIVVNKLDDILDKLLPFFDSYPLQGSKSLDFKDWWTVAHLMKDGLHLTDDGLESIRSIKEGMNTKRVR